MKKEKVKHTKTKSSGLKRIMPSCIDTYDLEQDSTLAESSAQLVHSSELKTPETLHRLCIGALNIYLQPLAAHLNEFVPVQYLKNLPKKSELNTPFYGDAPECLQKIITDLPKNDSELCQSSPKKNPPKIIITSNIVIKEASPEKRIVLRDIDIQKNERKRKQTVTPKGQSSKMKRKKKHIICNSGSSLSSNTSFYAADDSDYENFDSYIASCLQEQEEQENIPFGLSNIDFYMESSLEFQVNSWVIVKFASKKSVKHFIGKVLSINDKIPTVKFARKVKNSKRDKGTVFTYPNIEDICAVQDLNDVIAVLPDPQISRRGHYIFNLNFAKYNIQ